MVKKLNKFIFGFITLTSLYLFALIFLHPSNSSPLIIPLIFAVIGLLLIVILRPLVFSKIVQQDDIKNPEGKPKWFRDLQPSESEILKNKYDKAGFFKKNLILLISVSLVFDFGIFSIMIWLLGQQAKGEFFTLSLFFLLIVLVVSIISEGYFASLALDLNAYKRDLEVGVYKMSGETFRPADYTVILKGTTFNLGGELQGFYRTLKDGDILTAEYSPNTLILWKIYKNNLENL